MARVVRWTEEAIGDLDEIASYIGRNSRSDAASFIKRLRAAAEGVTLFPEAGALIPDFEQRPDIRETFVGRYRLIDRFSLDEVLVLTVVHSARRLGSTWHPVEE